MLKMDEKVYSKRLKESFETWFQHNYGREFDPIGDEDIFTAYIAGAKFGVRDYVWVTNQVFDDED